MGSRGVEGSRRGRWLPSLSPVEDGPMLTHVLLEIMSSVEHVGD